MQSEIKAEFVELFKILKFEGLANSGGQAKLMIGDGMVKVNGETETRKRRKIINGDCIEFNGQTINVVSAINSN